MIPGEILLGDGDVPLLVDRLTITVTVINTGDRPVQVGSHFHVAEVNPALELDRAVARGMRLAIPAGTSTRFEPGIEQTVPLVPFGGARIVAGFRGEVGGPLDEEPA